MRHILLSVLILLLALGFCLFSMFHIRAICQQALTLLSQAQQSAESFDFEHCRAEIQSAMQHWKRYEHYFGLTLTHDEIDDILERFTALAQYATLEDRDDFLAGCAELSSAIDHIREMELPSVQNIL